MADEGSVQPPASQEPATPAEAAAETEEKQKDTRSVEERIAALKKPNPVPQPDEEKVRKHLDSLNAKIETCDKRLKEIKAALEKATTLRESSKSESKGVLDRLKVVRGQIKTASQEREGLYQQLQAMSASRQAHQKSLSDLRKSLPFDDVAHVEAKVKELEAKISHGQCADLKEEKKVMAEIKNLNACKSQIAAYIAQRGVTVDDSEARADLERRKAEATARLDAAKKEADSLDKQLKEIQAKQQGPDGATPTNTNDLWKEQKELYNQIKEHRAEIRKVNTELREELNKYRDYTRALQNYKRALSRLQGEQRRAEWEARRAAEDKPADADVPSDDPLVGHPWADEMIQCRDLEKVLSAFLPREQAPAAAAPAAPA
eukprot:CAMPEP_0113686044 /NCGR_PEP_ID=MMETSP0038_2-20120614/15049_1 /TAXON_ID=2898 /ORGANISM="Cryptomonas paramecium" /LENGTH=374 /DNA_ID=CAMNT_0000606279 /DNA_START=15 /DNA_END=1135 /DNA_ORIENTATION=+ /assembly_acc=CAM_ASM_000170